MYVLIAGAGLTGAQLARRLLTQQHTVRLIERDPELLNRIHRELPTEAIYEGNATHPFVLEQAGIRNADVLVAFTPSDAGNLALCYLAKKHYAVPRTIAVINDPRNAWLFDQKFLVDVALDPTEVLGHLIEEEMSLGDMMTLLKLTRGQYSLVEQRIAEGSPVIGRTIQDVVSLDTCVIAAIIRRGVLIVPQGSTIFEVEDEVLSVTDAEGAAQLEALLSPPD